MTDTANFAQPAADRSAPWRGMTRWRASATHLALSGLIVGAVCALIFFIWYPHPYFQATGAWNVLRVLIGVDLVLGPLLTFIVFKPGKPGLKLDLSVIAAVQLTALVYGVVVIYGQRPYYTVFALDRFSVLARGDVDQEELADPALTAPERIGTKPWRGPLLLVAKRPDDPVELSRLVEETVFGTKADIEARPKYWQRFEDHAAEVLAAAKPLAQLRARRPEAADALERATARLDRVDDELVYLPVSAKNRDLTMLIDATTGRPLGVVDVDPWPPRATQ